jgi:hypothetical protein
MNVAAVFGFTMALMTFLQRTAKIFLLIHSRHVMYFVNRIGTVPKSTTNIFYMYYRTIAVLYFTVLNDEMILRPNGKLLPCFEFLHGVGGITFTSVALLGTYRYG